MRFLVAKAPQIAGRGVRVGVPELALHYAEFRAFVEQYAGV